MNTMMTMLYLTLLQVRDTTRNVTDDDGDFSPLWILLIIAVIGVAGYFIWKGSKTKELPPPSNPPHTTTPKH